MLKSFLHLIGRPGIFLTIFFCITVQVQAQTIEGRVIDSHIGSPLEYVGIGIVNSRTGAITDENGYFRIETRNESSESIVRISMIGYEPQVFAFEELTKKHNTIRLIEAPVLIDEVIIKPFSKSKKLGTTSYNRIGSWCGWGGSRFGSGHEIGTRIDLGISPVFIRSLHVHVLRQAFDTSLYRLHIRSIVDTIPSDS